MSHTVTDTVCGMTIDLTTAAASAEHEGQTYHFCCAHCHQAFLRDPGKYVPAP